MTAPVHSKVVWSSVAGFVFSVGIYELQKHNIWQPDGAEAAFLATIVAFTVGYIKRAEGEDTSDEPLAIAPTVSITAPNATIASRDPEVEALRAKVPPTPPPASATMRDPLLDIPPQPASPAASTDDQLAAARAAAAVGAMFLGPALLAALFLGGCSVATPIGGASVSPAGVSVSATLPAPETVGAVVPGIAPVAAPVNLAFPERVGRIATTLTHDAQVACKAQGIFNAAAEAASFFYPPSAPFDAIASAAVGKGCTWLNTQR